MIDTSKHEGLKAVEGFPFAALVSPGLEARAQPIAERCARAHHFLSETLAFEPQVALLVLSPEHWAERSSRVAYGQPHYQAGNLMVAGQPGEFWQGWANVIMEAPADLQQEAQAIYGRPDGSLDLAPFFDLLVVHELGHGFHGQVPFQFPRAWLAELFCNLCLYAYLAAVEPEQLPVYETAPRTVTALSPERFRYRSLDAFEALYDEVGPLNYGWYLCQLHVAAKRVYEAGGTRALRALWKEFAVPDGYLAELLEREVHPEIARILTEWPE